MDLSERLASGLLIVLLGILIYVVISVILSFQEDAFLRTYIGRRFVYYSDTITVKDYNTFNHTFTISKYGGIHTNIIYKLKEIKSE